MVCVVVGRGRVGRRGEEERDGWRWKRWEEVREVTTTFWDSLSRVVFRSVQNKADDPKDTI